MKLAEDTEAAEIGVAPACAEEKIANNIRWQGIVGAMIADHYTPAIGMGI
jgi:hypothetical protein